MNRNNYKINHSEKYQNYFNENNSVTNANVKQYAVFNE